MVNKHLGIEAAGYFLIACAVILTALGFEHIGGFIPCKLCLGQRIPYYTAIPLAAITCLMVWRNASPGMLRLLFAVLALIMAYSIFLGIRHSGVEWNWWEGPTDCGAVSGGLTMDAGNLLGQLQAITPPSCNEAAGRFLGLSFAGWNVLTSIALFAIALRAVFKKA
ncbi:MAG: disulfide bond formation protein B [Rhizobiaceae bacterium]|nr:disulfide bond formation protein B [Rhizobiaceae bacterium]